MKIKSLWISEYKNVKNLELNFNTDLTTLLVGKNGLGKSNLIEALAIIFGELDLFQSVKDVEIFSSKYFDFKLQYTCSGNTIDISLINNVFLIKWDGFNSGDFKELTLTEFKKTKSAGLFPKYIIGYYSGENKRLKTIINKHEAIEFDSLKRRHRDSKTDKSDSFRRLFFTENYHGQILLLTLALYQSHEYFGKHITNLFNQYLGIEELKDFSIKFKSPDWKYNEIGGVNKSAEFLIANINDGIKAPFWNLQGKVDLLLTRLYNYQVEHGSEPIIYTENNIEFIEFSKINVNEFSNELQNYFPHPIDFFNALESTFVVEIFDEIRIQLKKTNIEFPIIYSELSEGEQQLISVLGLILVVSTDDVLFLLDEPDTHLNPNWQRDYIRLLTKFSINNSKSHIFVATHSPLIVQAVEGKFDILLYHLDEDNKIEIDNDPQITSNWRIDQVLTSKYFGIENTRPINTDDFLKLKQEIIRKGDLTDTDKANLKALEDDLGYLPLGETIIEIESLAFLNNLANKHDIH